MNSSNIRTDQINGFTAHTGVGRWHKPTDCGVGVGRAIPEEYTGLAPQLGLLAKTAGPELTVLDHRTYMVSRVG